MGNLRKYLAQSILMVGAMLFISSVLIVAVIVFIGYSLYYKSFKRGYEEAKGMVTHFIDQVI